MSEQFIVEQLEILNDENDFKRICWWAVTNTQRIEDHFECRNKEVALRLCDFLNKAVDDIKYHLHENEKWSAKCKQLDKEIGEQQATIDKLEQRDYYNQSERYKILGRAIELASDYIHTNDLEYYDFCGLVTEFEEELLEGKEE